MNLKDYYKDDFDDFIDDILEGELDEIYGSEDFLGDLMTVEEFIECVDDGLFIDYDGIGYFSDEEGNEAEKVCCDVAWLKDNRGDYTHIMWYNR